ncbi:MAG TPA: hypothetical protein VHY08_10165 [Bacillota bacterium]|nr:hypothetical protein [Bacillota bacterium]
MVNNSDPIRIVYRFTFQNGEKKEFVVEIDRVSLHLINRSGTRKTYEWAELGFHRCPRCSLDPKQYQYCPIALNMIDLIEFFKGATSQEMVDVEIETKERKYFKTTTIQSGLSSLMGIYMVTTGCPTMEKLKPMVRFHLPFASDEETRYRAITMYLMAQYFLNKKGQRPDLNLTNLVKIYDDIRILNNHFCERLQHFHVEDASINAVVVLDCFANSVIFSITEDSLKEFELLFSAYM